MLSISHAAAGAFIAVKITNPYLAIPLILASHYALDAVAHWDVGTGLGKGTKSSKLAFLHEIPDLIFACLFVFAMYYDSYKLLPNEIWNWQLTSPYWGGFLALIPDFLEAPRNFLRKEPFFLKPLNHFHHHFHHSIPRPLDGLAPQLILLALIWYFH